MIWLVLLLVVGPLAELWVILQVAQVIGGWETIALLLVEGAIGGWLIKRQGRAVIRRLDERLRAHDLPTKELADGFLILAAGVLMLAPGFISDVIGFGLLFPPTRALARLAMIRRFTGRLGQGLTFVSVPGFGGGSTGRGGPFVDTTATEEQRSRPGAFPLGPGERRR